MKIRFIVILCCIFLAFSCFAAEEEFFPWREAIRRMMRWGNLYVQVRLHYSLQDLSDASLSSIQQEFRVDLWVRNWDDYRIDFRKPGFLEGIVLIYIDKEKTLFIVDVEKQESTTQPVDIGDEFLSARGLVLSLGGDFLEPLPKNPLVQMKAHRGSGSEGGYVYDIHIIPTQLFSLFRKEYPLIRVELDDLMNFRSIGFFHEETEEFLRIDFLNMVTDMEGINKFFQSLEPGTMERIVHTNP